MLCFVVPKCLTIRAKQVCLPLSTQRGTTEVQLGGQTLSGVIEQGQKRLVRDFPPPGGKDR